MAGLSHALARVFARTLSHRIDEDGGSDIPSTGLIWGIDNALVWGDGNYLIWGT